MALLEQVAPDPDWTGALSKALERPTGTPERRAERRDPDNEGDGGGERRRRLSDDLAWLRQAIDEPEGHGLAAVEGTSAVAIWETDMAHDDGRLCRLRDRGVLDAAGFLLHESSGP